MGGASIANKTTTVGAGQCRVSSWEGIPGQPGADAVGIVGGLCHGAIGINSALGKLDIVTFVDLVACHQRWNFINMNAVGLGDAVVTHSRQVKADAQAGKGKLVAVDGNFTAEGGLGGQHQHGVDPGREGGGVGRCQPPETLSAEADLAGEGIGRIGWIEEAERWRAHRRYYRPGDWIYRWRRWG